MDPIRTISIPKAPAPLPVVGGSVDTGPVLPKPAPAEAPRQEQADLQQAALQRRMQAVINAAKDIANVYVVSDKTFSIFKGMNGELITRFTNLRDGKVTYIPEPELLRMQQSSASPSISLKV